jgi:hypothetical protein
MLPLLSVSRVELPLQLRTVANLNPPPLMVSPPAIEEVAVVEVAMKYGAAILVPTSTPPEKVEVALEVEVM